MPTKTNMDLHTQDECRETCPEMSTGVTIFKESDGVDQKPEEVSRIPDEASVAIPKAVEMSEHPEQSSDHTNQLEINKIQEILKETGCDVSCIEDSENVASVGSKHSENLLKLDKDSKTDATEKIIAELPDVEARGIKPLSPMSHAKDSKDECRMSDSSSLNNPGTASSLSVSSANSEIQEKKLNNNLNEQQKPACSSENDTAEMKPCFNNKSTGEPQTQDDQTFLASSGFVESLEYTHADIQFNNVNLNNAKSLIEQILSLQSGGNIDDIPDSFSDRTESQTCLVSVVDRNWTTTRQETKQNEALHSGNPELKSLSVRLDNSPHSMKETTVQLIKEKTEDDSQTIGDNVVSTSNEECSKEKVANISLIKGAIGTKAKGTEMISSKNTDLTDLTVKGFGSENATEREPVHAPVDGNQMETDATAIDSEDQKLVQEDINTVVKSTNCDLHTPSLPERNINGIAQKTVQDETCDMECDEKDDLPLLKSNNSCEGNGVEPISQSVMGTSGADVSRCAAEKKVETEECKPTVTADPTESLDPEFVWEDYLAETGAQPAPPESFLHVEASLHNGFEVGQVVEVGSRHRGNQADHGDTYWLSRIVTVSGQLLGLCHVTSLGFLQAQDEDDECDSELEEVNFWCDAFNSELHPLGWCAQNHRQLTPPKDIESLIPNLTEFLSVLEGAATPAPYLFTMKCGTTPVDFIRVGQWLEVHEESNPLHIWPVRIIENVGGRLLLRYEGARNASADFWLFYLNIRLHELGWCKEKDEEDGYLYKAPQVLTSDPELEQVDWNEILTHTFTEGEAWKMPVNIFQDQEIVKEHSFKEGMKLEALHPRLGCAICPATVTRVFNKYFFSVQIDSVPSHPAASAPYEMTCHQASPHIFPVRWCAHSGLRLVPPLGWNNSVAFDWKEYMQNHGAEAAPEKVFDTEVADHDFSRGMKLEAVNPEHPAHVCVATIVRIVEHLMWLHLDSSAKVGSNHIVDVQSHDVFPPGWSESNDYPLKLPKKTSSGASKGKISSGAHIEKPMTADEYRSAAFNLIRQGEGSDWCPTIYFNHLCFSGGFLSKGRIAELPRSVGPGPINLVMKEVLTMLISVAYKSSRVLRELQVEGTPNPTMVQQVLKAKHKGKRFRAAVEVCRHSGQVEEYCRQLCIKLECCPLLVSPHCVQGQCPENCSQLTKTKYTACYLKNKTKRKQGRPPGSHSNLEGPRKPLGRKRKRKRGRPPISKDSVQNGYGNHDNTNAIAGENESVCGSLDSSERLDDEVASINSKDVDDEMPKKKRKYDRRVLPPTTVKTRGVKLPSYGTIQQERRSFGSAKSLKVKDLLFTGENGGSSGAMMVTQEFVRTGKKGRPRKVQTLIPVTHSGQSSMTNSCSSSGNGGTGVITPPTSVFKPIYTFKDETTLKLTTNPLYWTVQQVVEFIRGTDSAQFAKILKDQEIDGQALLMLSLPVVQEYLDYKLGPALKLCHHIERLKLAFYQQYA